MIRFTFKVLISFSMVGMLQSSKFNYTQQDLLVDKILWQPNVKLKWDDFQSIPDSSSQFKANTFVNILYTFDVKQDFINVDVQCVFLKKSSWSKSKSTSDSDLLQHEQLHFDNAEIAARKIRMEFSKYQSKKMSDTQDFIDNIIAKIYIKQMDSINALYDKQTNHGIIKTKQKEWEKKIALELKKMEKYSSTKVVIRRVPVK